MKTKNEESTGQEMERLTGKFIFYMVVSQNKGTAI